MECSLIVDILYAGMEHLKIYKLIDDYYYFIYSGTLIVHQNVDKNVNDLKQIKRNL